MGRKRQRASHSHDGCEFQVLSAFTTREGLGRARIKSAPLGIPKLHITGRNLVFFAVLAHFIATPTLAFDVSQ